MILQGVKPTIQPLGVGYVNRPKKARNGGLCGVFPYIRLPSFDLTTSAMAFVWGVVGRALMHFSAVIAMLPVLATSVTPWYPL